MLNQIIFYKIFFFLEKRKSLEIINYNKNIQNRLNLDLNIYKKTSGKYKVGGINGKGQEFLLDTNLLIFEGEYKNKKRNGKGKEYYYWNGILKFEGEYFNGKKMSGIGYDEKGNIILIIEYGKIEEYFLNGILEFEGDYINEKRWNGKGYNYKGEKEFEIKDGIGYYKEYWENDKLRFEGEYIKGEKNGKGKEYNSGEVIFEGEYLNGAKYNGKGKIIFQYNLKLILLKTNSKIKSLNYYMGIGDWGFGPIQNPKLFYIINKLFK